MIQLGLARIQRLLPYPLPWRAIHVAGTNGKGSICHYIAQMLRAVNLRTGLFTSPHLVHRWDSVKIDMRPVSRSIFEEVEAMVLARDKANGIGASEFELLTATAFEIFSRENVKVGVVETGMGGRLDATNIIENPLCTVISQIALDHQAYLGDTLAKIALEKAGIIKPGCPCIVEGRNDLSYTSHAGINPMDVIRQVARRNGSELYVVPHQTNPKEHKFSPWQSIDYRKLSINERSNMQCAATAVGAILRPLGLEFRDEIGSTQYRSDGLHIRHDFRATMLPALENLVIPGRLQSVSIERLTGHESPILLDGAHNENAMKRLTDYITHKVRNRGVITWVVAASNGRAEWNMLRHIVRPRDNYIVTSFGAVDGMPWIEAAKPTDIADMIRSSRIATEGRLGEIFCDEALNIRQALQKAVDVAAGGKIVVTGSLYLVGDVLRTLEFMDTVGEDVSEQERNDLIDRELALRRAAKDTKVEHEASTAAEPVTLEQN